MPSGTLPLATYHRTNALGAGSFGSVVTVYNDDGEEFALKLFIPDDDDENEKTPMVGMELGALREMSILRLLREKNGHVNIVNLVDLQSPDEESDGGGGTTAGAGTSGYWGMAIPFYPVGSLYHALEKGLLTSASRRVKVEIAHGILSAVAFLHDNGIFHRDIKTDNVMLEPIEDVNNDASYRPILIDFSLAKIIEGTMYHKNNHQQQNHHRHQQHDKRKTAASMMMMNTTTTSACFFTSVDEEPMRHTGEVGTVTYTAPEVMQSEPYYGLSCDLWSVGVVLLELLQNRNLPALKNKEADRLIEDARQTLPTDQPFPNLIRGLLQVDPKQRLTAREALASPLFAKFGFAIPEVRIIDITSALSINEEVANGMETADENQNGLNQIQQNPVSKKKKVAPNQQQKIIERRMKTIKRLCQELNCHNPLTASAAMVYSEEMFQLDDQLDDLVQSQSLLDCVVLATKFFEVDLIDLEALQRMPSGPFQNWDFDTYLDNEACIWQLMDFCLYPRQLAPFIK